MKKDTDTTATLPEPAAAVPPPTGIYEVLCEGPLKVGGVLAYRTARLNLTQPQADALLAAQPECIRFLGI